MSETVMELDQNNVTETQVTVSNKKPFDLNRKDTVFKFIFCIASVLLTIFGVWGGFRGGFTVTALILFISMTVYFASKKTKIKPFALICGILNCIASLNFLITSNSTIRFFSVICMLLLSAVWFLSLLNLFGKESDYALIYNIIKPIALGSTANLPKAVVSIFASGKKGDKKFGKVLLGIAFSVPVLFIVVPLLMQSDAAFSGFVAKFFGDLTVNIFKVLIGLIIGIFLVSYCFTLKKQVLSTPKRPNINKLDNTIVISFLSVLGVCYLMYLFSQLAYFFSAFKGILPDDFEFTFSAYARRGFFEMCVIAVINFIIIYATLLFSQKVNEKLGVISKILCTFIGFFTLIIIATAISKMVLYINSYGMTELRITTSAFMIFLAVVFISVMLKLYMQKIRVLKVAIIASACVLCVLGVVNVNRFIAEYNYNAYKTEKLADIDVNAIYELGEEGVPYLIALTKDEDEDVSESAKEYIDIIVRDEVYYEIVDDEENPNRKIINKKYCDIGQYSIARNRAYTELLKYTKKNPDVLESDYFEEDYLDFNEYF